MQNILLELASIRDFRPVLAQLEAGVNKALPRRDWDILMRKKGNDLPSLDKLHTAWSRVQERIAEMQLVAVRTREAFSQKAKEARQARKQEAAGHLDVLVERCDALIELLRDAADMLGWAVIAHQEHYANRIHRKHDARFPSDQKLAEYVEQARAIRREKPGKFVLISDLGTLVNVGDLVVIGPIPPPLSIEFVELKAGQRNQELAEVKVDSAEFKALNPKDQNQVRRLTKQQQRMEDVHTILSKDKGVDRELGATVKLYDPPTERRHWQGQLGSALEKVRENGTTQRFAVDNTLFVQVTRGDKDPAATFATWRLTQGLRPGLTFDYRRKRSTPLAGSMLGDPFDLETRLDLIFGDTVVLIHLVPDGFIEQLQKAGLQTGWESRAETDKIAKATKNWRPFEMDNRAIFYGLDGMDRMHFGDMWIIRIVFDMVHPSTIAEWQLDMAKRARTEGLKGITS